MNSEYTTLSEMCENILDTIDMLNRANSDMRIFGSISGNDMSEPIDNLSVLIRRLEEEYAMIYAGRAPYLEYEDPFNELFVLSEHISKASGFLKKIDGDIKAIKTKKDFCVKMENEAFGAFAQDLDEINDLLNEDLKQAVKKKATWSLK